jgi:hypothetical protein
MNVELIESMITQYTDFGHSLFNVSFVRGEKLIGIFINDKDFDILRKNNCWRMVLVENIASWNKSGDLKLTEIIVGKNIQSINLLRVIISGSEQFRF